MPFKIALDWTPNVNHIGLFVARAKGFIPATTELISPEGGGYTSSPARDCFSETVDLCIAPTETVIAYASPQDADSGPQSPRLVALATLFQRDTSAIAVLASNTRINTPKDLDGKSYASYNARYEGSVVRALVQNDGGKGSIQEVCPPRLDCFEHVLEGKADATWIFLPHEGCMAAAKGVELRTFAMGDFGIPYGYSPLLLAQPSLISGDRAGELRELLAGVAKGYQYAAAHPEEAADLLRVNSGHPSLADADFVRACAKAAAPAFLTPSGHWGVMELGVWSSFLGFLRDRGLLTGRDGSTLPPHLHPAASDLFTNTLLLA
jgi:ABC-type nitrate/sulfonate/bicarbonate transport system substrate-binding protein